MGKKETGQAVSALVKAREAQVRHQEFLSQVPVVLQVRDMEHALSPEVVEFCIHHLSDGGTWEVLRRKLGLGPAHLDRKWRKLRETLVEGLVPRTEEEALRAQANGRAFLVDRLEGFLGDVEGILEQLGDNGMSDKMNLPTLLKIKLDTIKTLLDENSKSFDAYVKLQNAKNADKKNQGVSILIQNNYHVPRPGDDKKLLKDVTETAMAVSAAKKLGSGD